MIDRHRDHLEHRVCVHSRDEAGAMPQGKIITIIGASYGGPGSCGIECRAPPTGCHSDIAPAIGTTRGPIWPLPQSLGGAP